MDRRAVIGAVAVLLVAACGAPPQPASVATTTASPNATPTPAALSQPSPSRSAEPAPTSRGTIAFMRPDSTARQTIWTACPDLSKLRQVPSIAGHDVGWQVWSPDGTRIAFNANYDDPDLTDDMEIWDIYTMDRDGNDVKRLTRSVGLSGDPGYSPDGRLIAFISTEPGRQGVWVMNAVDGGDQRLVTPMPIGFVQDFAPRFSPDGTRLVFTRYPDDQSSALWIVNLDGTGLRKLTPDDMAPTKAAWSPDGAMIAFDAASGAFPYQSIWTVRPDGTSLRNLNTPASSAAWQDGYSAPAWSPDGGSLILVYGTYHAGIRQQLGAARMRSDGTDLRPLSDGTDGLNKPDWTAAGC